MAFSSAVNKSYIVAKETTWGVAPAKTYAGAAYIPRVSFDLSLTRDTFASNRIDPSAQVTESRSGTDKVAGKLSDEICTGSHTALYECLLRGEFVSGVTTTAATIAANATTNKLVRSAGSWITDGFKIGDVIDITGFTAPATANNSRGMILALTATDMTLGGIALVTKAEGDSVTVKAPGKKLGIPASPSARTDDSFTIEMYDQIGVSRLSKGCKVGSAAFSIQPNSVSTVEFDIQGKDQITSDTAYFTAISSAAPSSVMAGNKAFLMIDSGQSSIVTGLDFTINGNLETGETVGNYQTDGTRPAAAIFQGKLEVSGTFTAYFENDTLFKKFRDEEELTLAFWMKGDGGNDIVYKMGRVKIGSATPNDSATGGTTQEVSFTALYRKNTTGTAYDDSCIVIQEITA